LSAFVSINREQRKLVIDGPPDDNCPICWRAFDRRTEEEWRIVKDDQGIDIGVAYLWQKYHFEDFVLYRSQEKGPANIGYVTGFQFPKNESRNSPVIVTMRRVGRMADLAKIAPPLIFRHEVRKHFI
jgi:DNA (cytosine-5)-methyltransferase 1